MTRARAVTRRAAAAILVLMASSAEAQVSPSWGPGWSGPTVPATGTQWEPMDWRGGAVIAGTVAPAQNVAQCTPMRG